MPHSDEFDLNDPATVSHILGNRVGPGDPANFPSLSSDLVLGNIRWSRALGLPEGDIRHAFVILGYHYTLISYDPYNPKVKAKPVKAPHSGIVLTEGPHDDHYYRLTYGTDAIAPSEWGDDPENPRASLNYLDVAFSEGMIWKPAPSTRAVIKLLRPTHLEFNALLGHAQVLPDIEVIGIPPSLYRT
jgi:hypothetical protein